MPPDPPRCCSRRKRPTRWPAAAHCAPPRCWNTWPHRYDVDLIVFRQPGAPDPAGADSRRIGAPRHRDRSAGQRPQLAARALRNAGRVVRRVPPLVDRFCGFPRRVAARARGRPLRSGRDRALLVRALPGAGCAGLRPHGARSAQYRIRAPRALRRSRRRRATATAHRVFHDASLELERTWLPRFSQVLATSQRDAASPAPSRPAHGRGLPQRHSPDAAARRRRRGGHGLFRQHGVSPQPHRGAILPPARSGRGLRERWPALVWRLVGKNPDAVQRFTAGDPRIEVAGPVEDAVRELAARVAVVPLLAGSGTRFKILEAWAAGLPVVSTTIGAEGLPVRDGETASAGGRRRRRSPRQSHGCWRARNSRRKIGRAGRAVAGKGVYMGNGLEEVGLLTQPSVILVRYTGNR